MLKGDVYYRLSTPCRVCGRNVPMLKGDVYYRPIPHLVIKKVWGAVCCSREHAVLLENKYSSSKK